MVSIHGFNVDQDDAESEFNEEFKRNFWLGFRGNFIGFTWDGDLHFLRDPNAPFQGPINFNVSMRVLRGDVRNHSDHITQPFYQIYQWWNEFLAGGKPEVVRLAAIPIGNEGK